MNLRVFHVILVGRDGTFSFIDRDASVLLLRIYLNYDDVCRRLVRRSGVGTRWKTAEGHHGYGTSVWGQYFISNGFLPRASHPEKCKVVDFHIPQCCYTN